MDLNGKKTLVIIEEDNMQRAYFRIRPLLWANGSVGADLNAAFPDDGFLRIVPDKNEQHTFKERMRSITPVCLLDLSQPTPEQQSKIRTNKNYQPERGERNQYIVYSDAVRKLPDTLVYEVVSVENEQEAPERVKTAITPLAFARCGLRMYGPYNRQTGEMTEGISAPAPDSVGLYNVRLNDQNERLIYWPTNAVTPSAAVEPERAPEETQPERQASPAPQKPESDDAPLAIGKPLTILDASMDHQETIDSLAQPLSDGANLLSGAPRPMFQPEASETTQNDKLSGTPLYRTQVQRAKAPRPRNALSALVDREYRTARPEPNGAQIKQGAVVRKVSNPVDEFTAALTNAWHVPETHEQLLETVLQMDGARAQLDRMMHDADIRGAAVAAMRAQLQDMEAERLAILIQLDEAAQKSAEFKKQAIDTATQYEKNELARIKVEREEAEALLKALRADIDDTARRLNEQALKLTRVNDRVSLHPPIGESIERAELVKRVTAALSISESDAIHILLLLALCPQIQLVGTLCDGESAAHAMADTLGAAYALLPAKDTRITLHPGSAPAMLVCPIALAPMEGLTQLILSETVTSNQNNVFYRISPWPSLRVNVPEWPLRSMPGKPVSMAAIQNAMLGDSYELTAETQGLLTTLCDRLALPHSMLKQVDRYLCAGAAIMPGGIAAALDYAVCAWFVPIIKARGDAAKDTLSLLAGLPRSSQHLIEC